LFAQVPGRSQDSGRCKDVSFFSNQTYNRLMVRPHGLREFDSKIDTWLAFLLILAIVYPIGIGVYALFSDRQHGVAVFLETVVASLAVGLVIASLAYPVKYFVSDGRIRVRSGWLMRQSIDVADIVEVSPSRNPLSSPALSLDRLAIKVEKNGKRRLAMLISPKDKAEFMALLTEIDKGLVFDGRMLSRKKGP